ncbi:MAG: mevalonate kinase [Bdellovibrionales bacterium]
MKDFSIKTYGKFILAGEHAVIRGGPALVFPLLSRSLELKFQRGSQAFQIIEASAEEKEVFEKLLSRSLEILGHKREDLKGVLQISNQIPIGSGLGASAALCVALARWFESLGWVKQENLQKFAQQLENVFHGESSGVDVAVSLQGQGIHYERNKDAYPLSVNNNLGGQFYLSYSGHRGKTSDCVTQVKKKFELEPAKYQKVDDEMIQAAQSLEIALTNPITDRREKIVQSMQQAKNCFVEWGLINDSLSSHLSNLQEAGALATKPTGSGGGGYVLSFWDKIPPKNLLLIPAPLSQISTD